jgi:putative aminopeptidase FrvX
MNQASKTLLEAVLNLPTMSFHETAVSTFVRWYATGLELDVEEDEAGNLLIKYRGGGKGGVTFAAHMDHPGFEVVSAKGKAGTVALWGKVDPKVFAGSDVIIQAEAGEIRGRIGKILPKKQLGRFCFSIKADEKIEKGDFGYYDLPGVKFSGDRISARAADNLMSVTAILDLMSRLVAKGARVNVTGLFTRCEEAGFLGAFAAMDADFIPRDDPLVVLECSSAAGGNCRIGDGPVIRAGDLQSTYDPSIDVWMSGVAAAVVKKKKNFQFQRALLQGGRCEACVYVAEGYRTGGIALPLGNYHNHGPKGFAPEYVSGNDYGHMLEFMEELAKNPMTDDALHAKVDSIRKHYDGLKEKLFESRD